MWVPQLCGQVGFAGEPLPVLGIQGQFGGKDFQCFQAGQAGMLDEVNLAHPPGPQRPDDAKPGEAFPRY